MKYEFFKRNKYCITILAIALFNFIFTLSFSGIKSLWYDDIYQLYFSWDRSFFESMELISKVDLNPPLWAMLAFVWLKIAPFGTVWVKLPSMILVSFTVILVSQIAKELYEKKVGVISAILFSLSSLVTIECSYSFRPYGIYLFASAFIIWAYIKKIKNYSLKNRLIFGLSIFTVAFTHYFGALLCVFFGLADLILFIRKRQKWDFIIEYAIVAVLELAWLIPQLYTINTALSSFWPSPPTLLSYFKTFKYLVLNSNILSLAFWALSVYFIFGIIRAVKEKRTDGIFEIEYFSKLIFLLVPVLFVLLIFVYSNIRPESSVWVDRYFLCLYPMIILFISSSVIEIYGILKKQKIRAIAFAVSCAICFGVLLPKYIYEVVDSVYTEYEPFEQVADMVMRQPDVRDGDKILLINTTNCGRGWMYYLSRNSSRDVSNIEIMDLTNYSSKTIFKYDTVYMYAVHFDGSFSADKIREEISQTHVETIIDSKYNLYKYERIR